MIVPSLVLIGSLLAQVSEKIEVSIVNVEVHVNDSHGDPVRGLTIDDFEIFENGRRQPITHFAEYGRDDEVSIDQAVPVAGEAKAPVQRQRRTIVIFVDRIGVTDANRQTIFDNVKTMLRDSVRPGDAVEVVSWGTILRVRQVFTDDLAAIERALDAVAAERTMEWDPDEQIAREREFIEESGGGDPITVTALDAANRSKYDIRDKARAVNAIVRSISAMEGPKVLLLFTHRFSVTAGREFLIGRGEVAGPRGYHELDFDTRPFIESVAKTASQNGVTVYPVFPEGLDNTQTVSAASKIAPHTSDAAILAKSYTVLMNETEALNEVADETGGRAAWGAINVAKIIPRIGDDLDSYYSLAYHSTGSDSRSRHIVVKTKRGFRVRHRRQHIEKSDEVKTGDRLLANLSRLPVDSQLHVRPVIDAIKPESATTCRVTLKIAVPVADLTLLRDGDRHAGGFSVYLVTGNLIGKVGDISRKSRKLSLTDEEVEHAKDRDITYVVSMIVSGLTDRISVGVSDDVSGEQGFGLVTMKGCTVTR